MQIKKKTAPKWLFLFEISNGFMTIFLKNLKKVLNNRGKDLKSSQKLLFYLENMILGVKNA